MKDFTDMSLEDLQVLYINETKIFIEALDNGTALEQLNPMRDRIKVIGSIIEAKLIEPKIALKTVAGITTQVQLPAFTSPTIAGSIPPEAT